MKRVTIACAALLALAGCSGPGDVDQAEPLPAGTTSTTPGPGPVTIDHIARFRTESGVHGLALCGHQLAYVLDTSRVVVADWKSGASRTVYSTDRSFLYAVRQVGCRLEVFDTVNGYNGEDPDEPGRTLSVDLRTGRVRSSQAAPFAPTIVGRSGARSVELVDGTSWRSLVLVTPSHLELLSSTGQVAWASMSGRHVAWIDGVRNEVPSSVYVVDVADPDSSVILAQGRSPAGVAVGARFVAWSDGGRQLVAPVAGGPVLSVPGPRSTDVWVAAHGELLARVVGAASDVVQVLRVGP